MSGQILQGLIQQGVRFHQAGNLEEAEKAYRNVLKADPDNAATLYAMGLLARDRGQAETAEQYLQAVLKLKPHSIDCLFSLGLWKQQDGLPQEAVGLYQRVLAIESSNRQALSNLGVAYLDLQQPEKAVDCFQKVLTQTPGHANALNNLGNALKMLHRLPEAINTYRQALQAEPGGADIWSNLGIAQVRANQSNEAIESFEQSLQLDARNCQTWLNLGLIYEERKDFPTALACYRRAMELDPQYPQSYRQLAHLVYQHGEFEGARQGYQAACELEPSQVIWQLQAETLCPIIPASTEQIMEIRSQIEACLQTFTEIPLALNVDQLAESSYEPSFYLPYHGLDDLKLKSDYADLLAKNLPPLSGIRPVKDTLNRQKPKVGFLVTPRHEGIFAKLLGSAIARLSAAKIDAYIICRDEGIAPIKEAAPEAESLRFFTLPNTVRAAVQHIREAEFDVIHYFEVGSDSLNYFLPLYGLAPIQCTSWGSPVTSGLPNMHYFLSSSALETPEHQRYYREKLVLLNALPTYYHRPILPKTLPSRQDFDIAPDTHIYSCLQNSFKLHPDMDSIFAEILSRDPYGELFLLEGHQPEWTELLRDRLRDAMPQDSFNRVRFLPRMPRETFLAFQAISDVMLDPIHFGGGNTTLEGLSFGTPVITMPSEFLRSRVTYGCYQKMGIQDCIARTPQEYVDLAVRLANAPEERQRLKKSILARCPVLYEDTTFIRELEDFFLQAVATYQQ